jgi:hypothetical protein
MYGAQLSDGAQKALTSLWQNRKNYPDLKKIMARKSGGVLPPQTPSITRDHSDTSVGDSNPGNNSRNLVMNSGGTTARLKATLSLKERKKNAAAVKETCNRLFVELCEVYDNEDDTSKPVVIEEDSLSSTTNNNDDDTAADVKVLYVLSTCSIHNNTNVILRFTRNEKGKHLLPARIESRRNSC